jgi:hypothetical protein
MKTLRVFLLALCATAVAFARDRDFHGVVNAVEGHYRVRHTHVPLLGFAMWFARPQGVSGVKLAVFEDFHHLAEPDDVGRIVEKSLGPGWYPFVRVRSRNAGSDGETTLVYANPSGGNLRVMIVNVESSEATVVELKLSQHAIQGWLNEPGEKAEDQSGHHHHRDD